MLLQLQNKMLQITIYVCIPFEAQLTTHSRLWLHFVQFTMDLCIYIIYVSIVCDMCMQEDV